MVDWRLIRGVAQGVAIATLFFIGYILYYPSYHRQEEKSNQLKNLLAAIPQTLRLDAREKSQACQVQGPLPDHACTPGAVFDRAGVGVICQPGYTKTVRDVPVSLKKKAYAEYAIAYPQPFGSYEADHLIPLQLGGSNDIANLFPEAAAPVPGFKEKDVVENYLHGEVCAGRVPLAAAQEQIANDWVAVYNNLTPEQVRQLKGEFHSWASP